MKVDNISNALKGGKAGERIDKIIVYYEENRNWSVSIQDLLFSLVRNFFHNLLPWPKHHLSQVFHSLLRKSSLVSVCHFSLCYENHALSLLCLKDTPMWLWSFFLVFIFRDLGGYPPWIPWILALNSLLFASIFASNTVIDFIECYMFHFGCLLFFIQGWHSWV